MDRLRIERGTSVYNPAHAMVALARGKRWTQESRWVVIMIVVTVTLVIVWDLCNYILKKKKKNKASNSSPKHEYASRPRPIHSCMIHRDHTGDLHLQTRGGGCVCSFDRIGLGVEFSERIYHSSPPKANNKSRGFSCCVLGGVLFRNLTSPLTCHHIIALPHSIALSMFYLQRLSLLGASRDNAVELS